MGGAPPDEFMRSVHAHPKDESIGKKIKFYAPTVYLQADDAAALVAGEEVTLMSWGNAIVSEVRHEGEGKVVSIAAKLHLQGSVKSTKKKLTWLADTPHLVDVQLEDYDFILTKEKPQEEDELKDILMSPTKFVHPAKGEPCLRQLQKGQIVQIERRGYYICDAPFFRRGDPRAAHLHPGWKEYDGVQAASGRGRVNDRMTMDVTHFLSLNDRSDRSNTPPPQRRDGESTIYVARTCGRIGINK